MGNISRQELNTELNQELDKINVLTEEMTPLPPVEEVLNRGQNNIIAEHQSLAKMKLLQGKTIVNHVPLFDSGTWNLHANVTVNSPNQITLNATASNQTSRVNIPCKPNQQYVISGTLPTGTYPQVNFKDNSNVFISNSFDMAFTTPSNAVIMEFILQNSTATGTFTFENIMINEGVIALPFVANVKGITNPTIENLTNGTSDTIKGTFYDGDEVFVEDNVVKQRKRFKELILDGSELWAFSTNYAGYKSVRLKVTGWNFVDYTDKVIKYNGTMLVSNTSILGADMSVLRNSDNYLYLSIANTDSGWGDSYTPTADEIKAYFLGWKMYEATQGRTSLYNGTGTKYWYPVNKMHEPVNPNIAMVTLPTIKNPNEYIPYRLIYELATPIVEVVDVLGSLTLEKGENILEVSEGRIVREVVNPQYHLSYGNFYYINANLAELSAGKLKNKAQLIIDIYKNDVVDDNWNLTTQNSYGSMKAEIPTNLFDTTAVYTVYYIPLEMYKVTAPLDTFTIEYQANMSSVVNELVVQSAQHESEISDIQQSMVRKGEGVEWFPLTLLNGLTTIAGAEFEISKDNTNTVVIRGRANSSTPINNGTVICRIPKKFRPSKTPIFTARGLNSSSQSSPIGVQINGNHELILADYSGTTRVDIHIMYKAEQ